MRVVLDTNVVVSGVFFGGTPSRVLAAWSAGRFVMVLSPAILDEYRRVGHDKVGRFSVDTLIGMTPNALLDEILHLPADQ